MKKHIIVIAIFIILGIVAIGINIAGNDSDLAHILNSDISTFEKCEKIQEMVDLKQIECENIKKDIESVISYLYKEDEIVSSYFTYEEMMDSFNSYYENSFKKINEQTRFAEYICSFKYQSGTYSSMQMIAEEYGYIVDFYNELKDLYSKLDKLRVD